MSQTNFKHAIQEKTVSHVTLDLLHMQMKCFSFGQCKQQTTFTISFQEVNSNNNVVRQVSCGGSMAYHGKNTDYRTHYESLFCSIVDTIYQAKVLIHWFKLPSGMSLCTTWKLCALSQVV